SSNPSRGECQGLATACVALERLVPLDGCLFDDALNFCKGATLAIVEERDQRVVLLLGVGGYVRVLLFNSRDKSLNVIPISNTKNVADRLHLSDLQSTKNTSGRRGIGCVVDVCVVALVPTVLPEVIQGVPKLCSHCHCGSAPFFRLLIAAIKITTV